MRIKNNIFILLLILSLAACKEKNNKGGVEKAVTGFFEGMYDRDFDKARAHATQESDEIISFLQQLASATPPQPGEIKPKISVNNINVENDTVATAMVKAQDQPNEIKMTVKKRQGEWKVAFDARSLSVMLGQDPDKMEKEADFPPLNDSLDIDLQKAQPDTVL